MVQPDAPEKEDRKRLPLGSGTAKAGGVESASLFKEEFGCTTMGWKFINRPRIIEEVFRGYLVQC